MWTDWIYVSALRAKEFGLTHHGSIYGVPAYLRIDEEEVVTACPKITVLKYYIRFIDETVDFIMGFMPASLEFVLPVTFGEPIAGGSEDDGLDGP